MFEAKQTISPEKVGFISFYYAPKEKRQTVYFGTESISILVPKIWKILPEPIKKKLAHKLLNKKTKSG